MISPSPPLMHESSKGGRKEEKKCQISRKLKEKEPYITPIPVFLLWQKSPTIFPPTHLRFPFAINYSEEIKIQKPALTWLPQQPQSEVDVALLVRDALGLTGQVHNALADDMEEQAWKINKTN